MQGNQTCHFTPALVGPGIRLDRLNMHKQAGLRYSSRDGTPLKVSKLLWCSIRAHSKTISQMPSSASPAGARHVTFSTMNI